MNIFRNLFTLKLFLKIAHAPSRCATRSLESALEQKQAFALRHVGSVFFERAEKRQCGNLERSFEVKLIGAARLYYAAAIAYKTELVEQGDLLLQEGKKLWDPSPQLSLELLSNLFPGFNDSEVVEAEKSL